MTGGETRNRVRGRRRPGAGHHSLMDGKPVSSQLTAPQMPEIQDPPPRPELLCETSPRAVRRRRDDMIEPELFSCGVPFLFIPLKKPRMLSWVKVETRSGGRDPRRILGAGNFVFSTDAWSGIFEGGHNQGADVRTGAGHWRRSSHWRCLRRARGVSGVCAPETRNGTLPGRGSGSRDWDARAGSTRGGSEKRPACRDTGRRRISPRHLGLSTSTA